jgi:hypothetical protein
MLAYFRLLYLMFYEGVRFIVFLVAVQRDRIHKQLRKNFFNKNFLLLHWAYKCESLTKNDKFGHF